jgi:hypothetical protein
MMAMTKIDVFVSPLSFVRGNKRTHKHFAPNLLRGCG